MKFIITYAEMEKKIWILSLYNNVPKYIVKQEH